jgi:heptosyltransferase-1
VPTSSSALKILIVRVSSLGDVVHNMPMVTDLHRHYRNAEIDWVVEEAYTALVGLQCHVRRVIPFALRRWRKTWWTSATRSEISQFYQALRATTYDLVLDTQGLLKTSLVMRLAALAPGGSRVGLANATEDSGYEALSRIFHTRSVSVGLRTHAVQRARLVAAGALGYPVEGPASFGLAAPQTSGAVAWLPDVPYAVFFHGTARAAKQWPQSSWVAIGQHLAQHAIPVLLAWGSTAEEATAHQLAVHIPSAIVLPRLSMMEAIMLAQKARLVIGVDTGLTHVAAAYCRPTVELYCDSPRWKTEGNWSPSIINLGERDTAPSIDQVQQAVDYLLSQEVLDTADVQDVRR